MNKKGFAFHDVIVFGLFIAMLVAVTLSVGPISSARLLTSRIACVNNLKQLGLVLVYMLRRKASSFRR